MKKFLFLMMMAALAMPMMQANDGHRVPAPGTRGSMYVPSTTILRAADIPEGMASVTLTAGDVWGDGSGYQMLLDADATTYATYGTYGNLGGVESLEAVYGEFEYKIPENADWDLSTTNIVINNSVTIYIPAGVYDYMITNPTPGDDRVYISSNNGSAAGNCNDFEFKAGFAYVFTITLGTQNDLVDLVIDDPFMPVTPTNVTADPHATSGTISWDSEKDPYFNLRYREYNPNTAVNMTWDWETEESFEGWYKHDNDGDGYNWSGTSSSTFAYSGTNYLFSASFDNNTSLDPDNWLISPAIPLNGTLSIMARNYSPYYLDNFGVFAYVGELFEATELVQLGSDITPPYHE